MNLPPNSNSLGSCVPVVNPKLLLLTVLLNALNCVWLNVLKLSARISKRALSVNANDLYTEVVKLVRPGPTIASLPSLPKPKFGPPFHEATGSEKPAFDTHW